MNLRRYRRERRAMVRSVKVILIIMSILGCSINASLSPLPVRASVENNALAGVPAHDRLCHRAHEVIVFGQS
jgi:hypothetical protein